MKILLSRHGNTFNSGDKVVWTGLTNDLPLTQTGREQALALGQYLVKSNLRPSTIYCSPLQRTSEYAKIVLAILTANQTDPSIPIVIDPRLSEIDYGSWTGRSQEEVIKQFGEEEVENWNQKSVWPENAGWRGSENTTVEEIQSFTKDVISANPKSDLILVVTSNGKLRYFLTLIANEFEKRRKTASFKVKTGNICLLQFDKNQYTLEYWDKSPGDLRS